MIYNIEQEMNIKSQRKILPKYHRVIPNFARMTVLALSSPKLSSDRSILRKRSKPFVEREKRVRGIEGGREREREGEREREREREIEREKDI